MRISDWSSDVCSSDLDRLIVQRTALINHTRGLLAEYGVVMPAGASRFRLQVDKMIEIAELSHLAKDLFLKLVEEYRALDANVSTLDDQLVGICRRSEERRVGTGGVSTCQSRWSHVHVQKKKAKLQ